MLNFVLNLSICLGLHFVLTQIQMTSAKIRQNSLVLRGGGNPTSPSPGLACACSGVQFVKFTLVLWDCDRILKFNEEHCNSLKLLKCLPVIDVLFSIL